MKFQRDIVYILVIGILAAFCVQLSYIKVVEPKLRAEPVGAEVIYNQEARADQKIIETIEAADKFVYFAVYTFTKDNIRDALLAAKIRGLEVRGVTDEEQIDRIKEQEALIKELRTAGIPVVEDNHSGIMHLKVVVTDKSFISGSFNWTAAATERNDEVLEYGTDEKLRKAYQNILEKLFKKYENSLAH
ncbi:MAG TPA: phospholipase D-like domain-containing protein [Patescibacteria group bacterium]|nr:phospholipase D-like domain-containing protein [Patescibacteria group bacterium]